MSRQTEWQACSQYHGYEQRLNEQGHLETRPINHRQPAQPEAQPAPNVVSRMVDVFYQKKLTCKEDRIFAMTAAAQVLLDEVEQVTYDVVLDWSGDARNAEDVSKNVRARLAAKPPQETRERQVTAILQETVKETNKQWVAAAEKIAALKEEPRDADGRPMPVCKDCSAEYPAPHAFDCAEAQQ